jgi:hypothetical protein
MNRTELINRAKEVGNRYYQNVKDCREYGWKDEKKHVMEWATAIEAMAELLNMSEDEYFETFFDD